MSGTIIYAGDDSDHASRVYPDDNDLSSSKTEVAEDDASVWMDLDY